MAKEENNNNKDIRDTINHVGEGKNKESEAEKGTSKKEKPSSSGKSMGSKIKDSAKKSINGRMGESKAGQTVETAKNVAKRTRKIFTAFSKAIPIITTILTNPITWIIFVVIFLGLVGMSGTSVLGPSDYGKNCAKVADTEDSSVSGGGGTSGGGDDDWTKKGTNSYKNAKALWEAWVGHGYSGAAAAGALGNIAGEGGFFIIDRAEGHNANNESAGIASGAVPTPVAGGYSVGGAGIYQITPYTGFAPIGDKKWLDAKAQTDFFWKRDMAPCINTPCPLYPLDPSTSPSWRVTDGKTYAHIEDPEKAVKAFLVMYERGKWAPAKVGYAKKAYELFGGSSVKADDSKLGASGGSSTGGASSADSGTTNNCTSGDDSDPANTSDIVKFATSIAYSAKEAAKGNSNGGNGWAQAPDAYKKAYKTAGAGAGQLLASCDVFVATVLRNTVDKDVPFTATTQQVAYFNKSSKWKKIDCKDMKAGDVIEELPQGHAMIYGGGDTIISASLHDRVGTVHAGYPNKGCTGNLVLKADYVENSSQAYRFVGKADPIK